MLEEIVMYVGVVIKEIDSVLDERLDVEVCFSCLSEVCLMFLVVVYVLEKNFVKNKVLEKCAIMFDICVCGLLVVLEVVNDFRR